MRYGEHNRQGIDVYEPRKTISPVPTVVFFYGGGWTTGSKQDYRFVGAALVRKGLRVCIPDYRLHPEVSFEEIQQDGHDAFRTIANQYYGGDLFLMGHSAGAHLALTLASGAAANDVAGIIALSAPSGARFAPGMQLPPCLFMATENDKIVPVSTSKRLAAGWAKQSSATLVLFDKGGHALIVGTMSPLLQWYLPVADKVGEFIGLHCREL